MPASMHFSRSPFSAWAVTPMIGVNDITSEVFTLAEIVRQTAAQLGLRRFVLPLPDAAPADHPKVAELRELAAPQQEHWHWRMDDDIHGGTQALRPIIGLTERAFGPVQPRNQCGGFATGGCFLHKKP